MDNGLGEVWKDVVGFEGRYKVSNFGRIKSIRNGKETVLRPDKMKLGYLRCHFWVNGKSKKFLLHILITKAFGVFEDGKEINHIDGDKSNNSIANLEACTRSQNMKHAFKMGLLKPRRGELNGLSKYTEHHVRGVLAMRELGFQRSKTVEILNLPLSFVKGVLYKKCWTHVSL